MGTIQRAPQGLLDLLSIKGVEHLPQELSTTLMPVIGAEQFYGSQQRTVLAQNNGALTEGTGLTIVPSPTTWIVLFGMTITVVKTATMTALNMQLAIRLNSDAFQELAVMDAECGPYGAAETGTKSVVWWAPYPITLPPNTMLLGRISILGADLNANTTLGAMVGMLG